MKAVVVSEPGGSEVLHIVDYPVPAVREGWSLVKVRAFGINRSEIFTRKGLSPSVQFPRVLGIECVGEIVVSTDEERLPIKQKVVSLMGEMGRAFDGSYAEYVLLPNQQIYPIASELSWTSLATIPETYYTAFVAMQNLKIQSYDKILVRGATSGVGLAFRQLVKAQFPEIQLYGSTRYADKTVWLREHGFTDGLLDAQGQLQTALSFSKVLELIGPKTIKDSIAHIEVGGIICSCGQLGGQWCLADFDPIEELGNDIYLTTSASRNVNERRFQELLDYIARYHMKIIPQKIYSLAQIQLAHQYLESKNSFGKVVINLELDDK